MKEVRAKLDGERLGKILVVVSRFNELVTKRLLEGAVEEFERLGVRDDSITVVWAPGAWEIPVVVKNFLERDNYDGVLALGAIIRGETFHFNFIATEVAKGLASISLSTGKPVAFGIITADTLEQAVERSGGKMGNKGSEAARSLVEAICLIGEK